MKTTDLDLDDDPKLQAKMRPIQLAGWLALVCFVIASMLGFFGKSSLTTETREEGRLKFEYARYLRQQTPDQLLIEMKLEPRAGGRVISLWMARAFLDRVNVEFFHPQPVSVEADGDEDRYEFKVSEKTDALKVSVQFSPRGPGVLNGAVRFDQDKIAFHQLTYF